MSQGDVADQVTKRRRKRQRAFGRISMSLFENDHRIPSAASLVELADALRCSVDYLLGRIDRADGFTTGPAGDPGRAEATTPPRGSQVAQEAPKPARKRPEPPDEPGPSLEELQAQADKEGRTMVLWRGRWYMRRRQGWETLP